MNIFRILGNALVFFLSSKQRQIIRKEKKIRKQKRGRAYLASPVQPPEGPAHHCSGLAHRGQSRLPPPASRQRLKTGTPLVGWAAE